MPKKTLSQRDAERRAEARRRARLEAQGRLPEDDGDDEPATATPAQPRLTFFQRIFPPVPQLPGKAEPLAGFTYSGALRPLALTAWLVQRNLYASFGMGLLWAATYILADQYVGSPVGTIASFASFGSLVAAGWLGWRRPWVYGLVAALIGYLLYAPYFVFVIVPLLIPAWTPAQVALYLGTNGLMQAAIGALAGFYGGYLRRRLADPATRQAAAARRRR